MLSEALAPEHRYTSLLVAGCVVVAAWTVGTTLYVDWLAYSPMPWGDHWNTWLTYLDQPGLTLQWLISPHNEHRIATARALFWVDHHFFAATNTFLYLSVVGVQLGHAALLWRLGVRTVADRRFLLPVAAVALTATFSSQQFTNFTWAFQVSFVMVFLFANASFYALLRASRLWHDPSRRGAGWVWVAVAAALAWLASYSLSNGLLAWPLLLLLGTCLGMPRQAALVLALNAAAAWGFYFHDRLSAGTLAEGVSQLPKSLTYALVVLGLPVDETASAVMRTFGLPAPQYPGLGGDSLAAQAWRPWVSASVGTLGLIYAARLVREALGHARKASAETLTMLHCVAFVVGTVVLIGLGRSPAFDVVAVMQSRFSTPALLFWACLGILFLGRQAEATDPSPAAAVPKRLEAVLAIMVLAVAINQPSKVAYARGYTEYLAEVEAAMAANVYIPEVWGRVHRNPQAIVPVVEYFRQHRLSVFARESSTWPGRTLGSMFEITDGCLGNFDEMAALASGAGPGLRVQGWAWDELNDDPPSLVVLADQDGRIVGTAANILRREDVSRARPVEVPTPWVGWRGFVTPTEFTRLDAYLVRTSDNTACRVGTVAGTAPR